MIFGLIFTSGGMILSILIMLIGMLVQFQLKRVFEKYSEERIQYTGKEIAEKMLKDNGIYDVSVISVPGMLTDHYNPVNKTVNLSDVVFNQANVSAAAVAAHECGHAVQHATSYTWLTMRSKLVPVVNVTSNIIPWILMAGVFLINAFPQLLLAGIFLFAATTLFTIITLPVEFDASKRALAWLDNTNTLQGEKYTYAKKALSWAASTYVVAALGSLATLLHYIMVYTNRRD